MGRSEGGGLAIFLIISTFVMIFIAAPVWFPHEGSIKFNLIE